MTSSAGPSLPWYILLQSNLEQTKEVILHLVDNWSNPVVGDVKVPKVSISQLPVLLNLSEMVVSQIQDLPGYVLCVYVPMYYVLRYIGTR